MRYCFQVKFRWMPFSSFKSRKSISQSETGRPSWFFDSPPPILVEDVEILLPVKFRWMLFRGFREEVKNVSAYQRSGPPSWFSDWPEKHTNLVEFASQQEVSDEYFVYWLAWIQGYGRLHWELASNNVVLKWVQRLRRRNHKCLNQSETGTAFVFKIEMKTKKWQRT